MLLYQTETCLNSNGKNINKIRSQSTIGDIIFANTSNKGWISKIYKELTKINTTKTNKPIIKCTKHLNRHFSKEDIMMAKRYLKRCSTSLVIREMQIRTMMRYHLTPDRMAVIHKPTNSKCWPECGAWGTLLPCGWECRLVRILWKSVWR